MTNQVKKLKDLLSQCRPYLNDSKFGHAIDLLEEINTEIGNPAKYIIGDVVLVWVKVDSHKYNDLIGKIALKQYVVDNIIYHDVTGKYSYKLKFGADVWEDYAFKSIQYAKEFMVKQIEYFIEGDI